MESQQIAQENIRDSFANRMASFLRSVLPVDRWQLVFIAGLVCLTVSPRLHWWPRGIPQTAEWYAYSVTPFYLIIGATAVGYAFLLWRLAHPARRLWLWVCLPASWAALH